MIALFRRMVGGAAGPLVGALALFALPLLGSLLLDDAQFAFWSILASISTVALSLDFGGLALLAARFNTEPRGALFVRSAMLSSSGSVLVGLGACGLWTLISGTELGAGVRLSTAIGAILVMTLSAAVRSALMILAQAALMCDDYAIRNICTAGHAFLAVALTSVLLIVYRSFWALPLGWLVSGVVVLVPVLMLCKSREIWQSGTRVIVQPFHLRGFVVARTLTTLLNATLLQGDRWMVGLLGGPAALAVYEIAWRFATLPKFLVQNLSVRSGAEASVLGASDRVELTSLVKNSLLIATVCAAMGAVASSGGYLIFTSLSGRGANTGLFIGMVLSFSFVGVSSIFPFVGTALGVGTVEIPYLIVSLLASALAAILGAVASSWLVFVSGYLVALAVGAGCLFIYGPRVIARALAGRSSSSNALLPGDQS